MNINRFSYAYGMSLIVSCIRDVLEWLRNCGTRSWYLPKALMLWLSSNYRTIIILAVDFKMIMLILCFIVSVYYPILFLCDIQTSVLWMENNQVSGNKSVRGGPHYDITVGNNLSRDIYCDVTISNVVTMCIYHDIIMHNDVTTNLFYSVIIFPIYVILLLVVWNKNMTKFCVWSVWAGELIHCFDVGLIHSSLHLWNISTQTQLMCSPRLTKHSLVLVIVAR